MFVLQYKYFPPYFNTGETQNFENAFNVDSIKVTSLPLAFYSGMYAYAGW